MSKNDDSPTLPSLNPTSGAAVDVWRRRRLLLRELVFESLPLLFALVVLRLKYRVLLLKLDYLAFKRLVLLFRQRKSLAQDRGGPVLSNCSVPCDHVPVRSWPLFRAREVMREVIASLKQEQGS